jgi:hypothetical protein
MYVRFWALLAGRFLPSGRFLVLISVKGWVEPRTIVRLEGFGKFKKITSSGTRAGDLPACSIVPQPTMLPRSPEQIQTGIKLSNKIPLNINLQGSIPERGIILFSNTAPRPAVLPTSLQPNGYHRVLSRTQGRRSTKLTPLFHVA